MSHAICDAQISLKKVNKFKIVRLYFSGIPSEYFLHKMQLLYGNSRRFQNSSFPIFVEYLYLLLSNQYFYLELRRTQV